MKKTRPTLPLNRITKPELGSTLFFFSTLCPFLKTISFPPLCSNNIRNVSVNNMAYIFLKSTMMIIWFSTWIKNISWYKYWQMLLCTATALLEIMRINYFNFRKFPIISIQYLVYMTNTISTVSFGWKKCCSVLKFTRFLPLIYCHISMRIMYSYRSMNLNFMFENIIQSL